MASQGISLPFNKANLSKHNWFNLRILKLFLVNHSAISTTVVPFVNIKSKDSVVHIQTLDVRLRESSFSKSTCYQTL